MYSLVTRLLFVLAVLMLPHKLKAEPLLLHDIHFNVELYYNNATVSNSDKSMFYHCIGTDVKAYSNSESSLMLTQNIQMPSSELGNCAMHIAENKLFVIRSKDYFVYTMGETGDLTLFNSGILDLDSVGFYEFYAMSDDVVLIKVGEKVKVLDINADDATVEYSHDIDLVEKNVYHQYSRMFKKDEYLFEYVKGTNSAAVVKYRYDNGELLVVKMWRSTDLVDIGYNNHNSHSFFMSEDLRHLVYTHNELQVIYELTDDEKIVCRYKGTEAITLKALNQSTDMLVGQLNNDSNGSVWGFAIDFNSYKFKKLVQLSEYSSYWSSFANVFFIENNNKAVNFDDNFQILKTKTFGIADNGLAQLPRFPNSTSMTYDETNKKLLVLGQNFGWKLFYWDYDPELNTMKYQGSYNFDLPTSGDAMPKEMYLIGIGNNKVYVRYHPSVESVGDKIYTLELSSDGLELKTQFQLSTDYSYSINNAHIDNQGLVVLHENDPDHYYTWCPIQENDLVNSCEIKQFKFSGAMVRPSSTYKIIPLNQANKYLLYGAEYGRQRRAFWPNYSDAHIIQYDKVSKSFSLSHSLQGLDGFIESVYLKPDWPGIYFKVDFDMKGYKPVNNDDTWIEINSDNNFESDESKVNQDSIFVADNCKTFIYSEVYEWLYPYRDATGDFRNSYCFQIDNSKGINLGSVGIKQHLATYNTFKQFPTMKIRQQTTGDFKQDEPIQIDLAEYFVNPKNLSITQGQKYVDFDGRYITGTFDKLEVSGEVGEFSLFKIFMSDGDENTSDYLVWLNIENTNDAPFLPTPIEHKVLSIGEEYAIDFDELFIDPDGHRIRYNYDDLPFEFEVLNFGKIKGVFNESGEYSFTVIATDTLGASTRETITFTVELARSSSSTHFFMLLMLLILFQTRRLNFRVK